MTNDKTAGRAWVQFGIVSIIFFFIVGATYTSLGIALPSMSEELDWSRTTGGLGYTLLGLFTGLVSLAPAWIIRRLGVKSVYAIGAAVMGAGFIFLTIAKSNVDYFIGCSLLGSGFPLCANVPAIYVINHRMPDRRSFAIGLYMFIGGLGGVAGPLVVNGIIDGTGSWRDHFEIMSIVSFGLAMTALFLLKNTPGSLQDAEVEDAAMEKHSEKVYQSTVNWTLKEAIRTHQYLIIVAAMTMTLFCGITMNTWAYTHLGGMGVAGGLAAGALSAHAAINSFSRLFGGALATSIDPKWLLVTALLAEAVGMLALAVADDPLTIALFAFAEGYGFGMCFYTTTVLLVNYFGPKNNPEILGMLNLITTLAMLGPVTAGYIGDKFGGFSILFQGFAGVLLVILILTAMMQPPAKGV